jgi:triacylglycerol esterase/lipase EstA (alpha/beta hydrolase family)
VPGGSEATWARALARAAAVLVTLACALPASAAAQAEPSPPGANDWSCQPSAAHPNPVVLVHGLGANMSANWGWMSPRLADEGYCVFALTYGREPRHPYPFNELGGVVPMEQSAEELSAFVDRVLAATMASEVDIVGHSEGSLMPNYFVKFLGGADKVDRYVGLTPLWRGTDLGAAGTLYQLGRQLDPAFAEQAVSTFAQFCGSCPQFVQGSPFLEKMNEGGAAAAGVSYTNVMTRYDLLVVPYTSGMMHAPNAANVVLQDQCSTDLSEHSTVAFDPVVLRNVLNALDPANAKPVRCTGAPPILGAASAG